MRPDALPEPEQECSCSSPTQPASYAGKARARQTNSDIAQSLADALHRRYRLCREAERGPDLSTLQDALEERDSQEELPNLASLLARQQGATSLRVSSIIRCRPLQREQPEPETPQETALRELLVAIPELLADVRAEVERTAHLGPEMHAALAAVPPCVQGLIGVFRDWHHGKNLPAPRPVLEDAAAQLKALCAKSCGITLLECSSSLAVVQDLLDMLQSLYSSISVVLDVPTDLVQVASAVVPGDVMKHVSALLVDQLARSPAPPPKSWRSPSTSPGSAGKENSPPKPRRRVPMKPARH